MKRLIAFLLILLVLGSSLMATPISYKYTPYEESEFPLWTRELRRAETLFFGSYVLSIPLAAGAISLAQSANLTSLDSRREAVMTLAAATGVSLFIAGLDWILGRI